MFSPTGGYLGQWPVRQPRGVAVDASGVFVASGTTTEGGAVSKFTPAGDLIARWGASAAGPASSVGGASALATDSAGSVYVADVGNHRIQKFARE